MDNIFQEPFVILLFILLSQLDFYHTNIFVQNKFMLFPNLNQNSCLLQLSDDEVD